MGSRAALLVAISAVACGRGGPQLAQPVGETHTTASSTGGARPQGTDTPSDAIGVVVSDQVRRACDLPRQPQHAPRFDFDSARLRPRGGEDILARIASCATSGKLVDARLTIVGHTDPRGAAAYNEQLGLYRALAAKQYLADLGVPAGRLTVESLGARAATGTEESSWALDRRVEVRVEGAPAGTERP